MTSKELQKFFKEHLVPARLYKLNGTRSKRICLRKEGSGWDIFYRVHKKRIGLTHFTSESAACAQMKEEIRKVMETMYGITWRTV